MSHFITLVLIPLDTPAAMTEAAVAALLEPFDENIAVDPYPIGCSCVGQIAYYAGADAANHTVADLDDLRVRYGDLPEEIRPTWEVWTAEWRTAADRVEQAHALYHQPNPACAECHGTGTYMTTYNPQSQWDWWVIGGRWEGWLSRSNRLRTVQAAQQHKIPFAVVTPDGQWHAQGRIGWWGMASEEKTDDVWANTVQQLLLAYPDATAVSCDLHI